MKRNSLLFFICFLYSNFLFAQNIESFTNAAPALSVVKNTTGTSNLAVTVAHSPATMTSAWGIYRVWLNITIGTRMEYMTLTLTSPGGVVRKLVTAPGTITSYSNFQDTYFRDDAPMTLATLYAAAGTAKNNSCASFLPEQSINGFNTVAAPTPNGTWVLTVTNTYNNIGTYTAVVNNWGIEFRDTPGGDKTSSIWVTNSETGYPAYNVCATPKKMDKYMNYYGRTRLTYAGDAATDPPTAKWQNTTYGATNTTLDNTIWYSFKTDATGGTVNILFSFISILAGPGSAGYQAIVVGAGTPCVAANWTEAAGTTYSGFAAGGNAGGASVGTFYFYNSELVCTGLAANTVYYVCVDGNGIGPVSDIEFQIEATGALLTNYSTLPIELTSVEAQCENKKVSISWQVASQTNNNYFSIERTTDGINFETIGTVEGAGSTSQSMNYSFIDDDPLFGISYYRLRQTDFDGKTEVFNLVSVSCDNENTFSISLHPNPAGNELNVVAIGNSNFSETFLITDLLGQTVLSVNVLPNSTTILNIEHLAKGVYFVLSPSKEIKPMKFIKQ